jgi:choline dehydrogenase-like flavoprotein
MKNDRYEIIIVGSGLAGWVAGALLAKQKRPVLLLKEKGFQTSFTGDRYRFKPFSSFSEKCPKPSMIQKLIQKLDLPLPRNPQE